MPGYVLVVDFFGAILAAIGFLRAFRQAFVRRIFGRPPATADKTSGDEDPLTYILRIAGVMTMAFGVAIGGMVTLVNLAD